MHTTGFAHLTNYDLYSSSLFMSLYEDKNAQEKKIVMYKGFGKIEKTRSMKLKAVLAQVL